MDDDEAALHGRWSRRRGAWQWTAAAQWSTKNKFYEARDPQYPNGGRTDRYRQQEGWISVGTAHTLSSHWRWAYVMDANALGAASAWRVRTRGEENDGAASPFAALPQSEVDCHVAALTPRSVQLGTTERPDQPGHGGRRRLLHVARRGADHSLKRRRIEMGGAQ